MPVTRRQRRGIAPAITGDASSLTQAESHKAPKALNGPEFIEASVISSVIELLDHSWVQNHWEVLDVPTSPCKVPDPLVDSLKGTDTAPESIDEDDPLALPDENTPPSPEVSPDGSACHESSTSESSDSGVVEAMVHSEQDPTALARMIESNKFLKSQRAEEETFDIANDTSPPTHLMCDVSDACLPSALDSDEVAIKIEVTEDNGFTPPLASAVGDVALKMEIKTDDPEGVGGVAEAVTDTDAGDTARGEIQTKLRRGTRDRCQRYGREDEFLTVPLMNVFRKNKYLHKCSTCVKVFPGHKELLKHSLQSHGDDRVYKCAHCPRSFKRPRRLESHMHVHGREKAFKCDDCFKSFTRKDGLALHKKVHDEPQSNARKSHRNDPKHQCHVCGLWIARKAFLKRHLESHASERKYFCDLCDKSYKTKCVMLTHRKTHEDLRPFRCDLCGRCFSRYTILKNHLLTHTRGKQYPCNQCGRRYSRVDVLRAHKKRHCGEHNTRQGPLVHKGVFDVISGVCV